MSEKKGFWASLFGGGSGSCCNMQITEEPEKKGGGCNMEIVEEAACCTGLTENGGTEGSGPVERLKILGPGCRNCLVLLENTRAALKELGIEAPVEYVTDTAVMARYGILSTPALVVNEKVILTGKVPKTKALIKLLRSLDV